MTASKIKLGQVVLNVSNLALQTQFYQQVIGLAILNQTASHVDLGIAGSQGSILRLEKTELTAVDNYGLFHIAILLPDRPSLGTVFKHLLTNKIPLQGGSDHGYSEAIYLEDTEGNGIELYRDKPMESWDIREDGRIIGTTVALDADGLLAEATTTSGDYRLPAGTRVGHVHLSVPDAKASSQRFQKVFGLEDKFSMPSASFIASGTYHHHIAFNHWAGQNLAKRQAGEPGLNHLTIAYFDQIDFGAVKKKAVLHGMTVIEDKERSVLLEDPDGIRIFAQLV